MAKSLNRWTAIGNLVADPETRSTNSGESSLTNLRIAVNDSYKKRDGTKVESTLYMRVACFGKLSETVAEYLQKGAKIYVEGRVTENKWQDKDGNDRYTTEVVADNIQFLDAPPASRPARGDDPF